MSSDTTPHVLVLAAGAARRFGTPKQLAHVAGEPLLARAVARATELAGHDVSVVLGAHAATLAPLLRRSPATVVINRRWDEGLASSLRQGIGALPGSCPAVLVMLADQVAVSTADLRRLVGTWQRQPDWLVAASYDGHTGVPAIFPRHAFPALQALRGDAGARAVLAAMADRCIRVPMPQAAIDIDTPDDLRRFEAPPQSGN